jgi:quinol monooxygenase YgiN
MEALIAGLFVMIIEFDVRPERRDAFVAVTAQHVDAIRAFDGNVQFDVLVDDKRPGVVVYVERWKSEEQQHAFFAWWQAQGLVEELRPYVTAAPRATAYRQAVD